MIWFRNFVRCFLKIKICAGVLGFFLHMEKGITRLRELFNLDCTGIVLQESGPCFIRGDFAKYLNIFWSTLHLKLCNCKRRI